MPSFKYVIELSDQDKATLMDIVKKGNSPARTILRANILLASDKQNDKYMTINEQIPKNAQNHPITAKRSFEQRLPVKHNF